MAITVATNFKYEGQSPNFERDQFKTRADMLAYSPNFLDEGHISYCLEDKKYYKFNGESWEEFSIDGNGVPIVSSVDELDPDAPIGSLAVLAEQEQEQLFDIRNHDINNNNAIPINIIQMSIPQKLLDGSVGIILSNGISPEELENYLRDNWTHPNMIAIHFYSDFVYYESFNSNGVVDLCNAYYNQVFLDNIKKLNNDIAALGGVFLYGVWDYDANWHTVITKISEDQCELINAYLRKEKDTTLYIKKATKWEKFEYKVDTSAIETSINDIQNQIQNIPIVDVVNNVEDGGVDKALSAEMGKVLNEKINNKTIAWNFVPPFVDLGLPSGTLWASCNVGAESPEEYGSYFAWGETSPKSSYYETNSVTSGLSISELESRGIIDSNGNLTAEYDAAATNWGDSWRIPTVNEMNELYDKCTYKQTSINGVKGYNLTGPNGNSIFLPFAGYRVYSQLYGMDSLPYYLAASSVNNTRHYGLQVRPVLNINN